MAKPKLNRGGNADKPQPDDSELIPARSGKRKLKNDSVIHKLLEDVKGLDLDAIAAEEEEGDGIPAADDYVPPISNRTFGEMNQGEETRTLSNTIEEAVEGLRTKGSSHRQEYRGIYNGYIHEYGGMKAMTQAKRSFISSASFLEFLERRITEVATRTGLMKIHRGSGKLALTQVIEKSLLPIIASKRLMIESLEKLCRNGDRRSGGSYGGGSNGMIQYDGRDPMEVIDEMCMIEFGHPADENYFNLLAKDALAKHRAKEG